MTDDKDMTDEEAEERHPTEDVTLDLPDAPPRTEAPEPVSLPPPPPVPETSAPSPSTGGVEREKEREKQRDSSKRVSRDRDEKKEKDSRRKDTKRSRSRDRSSKQRSKSRSRSRDRRTKRRSKSRSKSRDRRRARRSRSRDGATGGSGDRRSSRHVSRSRSRSRDRGGGGSKHRSKRGGASRSRSRDARSRSHGGSRRHSRSSSPDQGGYVPRRRGDDKVPGPSASAAPRASAVLPAVGLQGAPNMAAVVAGHATNTDPFAHLRQAAAVPADPNAAARLWQEQQLHARQVVLQQQAAAAAAAATKTQREARRLYVGNLGGAGRVTDMALKQLFNAALMPAFPGSQMPGMEPVVNLSMHSEGRYCFVELRNAEMATAAMQLSGQVQLPGLPGPLTVERPSGYVDPTRAQQAAAAAQQALVAFQAGDTATMTMAATLSASLTGMPNAAAGMPGVPGSLPGLPAGLAMMLPGPPALPAAFGGVLPGPPALPAAVAAPLAPPVAPPADMVSAEPTAYLCVTGVVTASVLKDDRDYDDVRDELEDECGRHAPSGVREVKVPRPPVAEQVDALFGTGHYGRAFIHFADAEGASKAQAAIHGRLFAGITVQAVYVTQAGYDAVDA